jgi:hypothetical protein
VIAPGEFSATGKRRWYLVAVRRLRCDPPAGSYADPGQACRALDAYLRGQQHAELCRCPYAGPPGRIVGVYRGRRLRTSLDACSICNAGAAAQEARAVLVVR